ncbi:MAG: ABC transporter permease [Solirubrobacterales bacterium]|nr:ABC transporter permease [Solirubrobacterales bacterium]
MSALLRAELLKLRTTRTFAALVGAALALSLLVVVLSTTLGSDFDEQDVRELFTFDFTPLFILLLGVMGMAGEWRHRTITSTILAAPDRLRLLTAKMLAYAAAGIVLSLIVTVAIMAVGSLVLSGRGETTIGLADLAEVLWPNLVVAALLGAFGVAIGGLVRNQVVAIVGVFMLFAVEPAVIGLAIDVGRFGPIVGAPNGIIGINPIEEGEDLLAPGIAVLVMLGWILAGFAATAALLRGRDLV